MKKIIFYILITIRCMNMHGLDQALKEKVIEQSRRSQEHALLCSPDVTLCTNVKSFRFWHSPIPALNIVTRSGQTTDEQFLKDFNWVISYAKNNNLPISWTVYETDKQENPIDLLELFYSIKCPASIMVHQLQQVPDIPLDSSIKPISADNLTDWLTAFSNAFDVNDSGFMHALKATMTLDFIHLRDQRYRKEYYGGYLNDKLVTTGSLFITPDYAEIGDIGTINKARKNKMATIMIGALLQRAQQLNVPHVILTAGEEKEEFFKKTGFVPVAKSNSYILTIDYPKILIRN